MLATQELARKYPASRLLRYSIAVAAVVAAMMVARVLPAAVDGQSIYYLAAVVIAGSVGGVGPALVAAAGSLAAVEIWAPPGGPDLDLADGIVTAIPLLVATVVGMRTGALRAEHAAVKRHGAEALQARSVAEQERIGADRARDELTTLLSSLGDAVVAMDSHAVVKFVNPAARELLSRFNVDTNSVIGKPLWDSWPAVAQSGLKEATMETMREQRMILSEHYFPEINRWIERRVFPVEQGGAVLFARDITSERLAAAERAQLSAELDSERRLVATVLQQLPVAVLVAEAPTGQIILFNRRAEEIWGEPPVSDSLDGYGTEWTAFRGDGERVGSRDWPLARALLNGETIVHELLILEQPNGTRTTLQTNAAPVRDDEGHIVAAVIVCEDVTEKQRAEHELRRTFDITRGILSSSGDAIFVKDREGHYLTINDAGARLLGRTVPDVLGKTDAAVLRPDEAARSKDIEADVLHSGEPRRTESPLVLGGERRIFLATRSPYRDMQGDIVGVVGVATDITESKHREENARMLAEVGRVLTESIDYEHTIAAAAQAAVPTLADWCAVSLINAAGTIRQLAVAHVDPDKVRWAKEVGEHLPHDPNSPHGIAHVIRTGEPELYQELNDDVLAHGAATTEQREIAHAIGIRSLMIVPMRAQDRILGAISFISSESGRRYDTDDLALAEEIGRRAALAIVNAELYRDAQAANIAKSEFLATMSHELRTPLTAIIGYEELLADGITGPVTIEQGGQLRRIKTSALHLLQLIDEVLTLSRVETGREHLTPEKVSLAALLWDTIERMRPLAEEKSLTIHLDAPDPDVVLHIDGDKLRQILRNLLSNAVKFTDRGGIGITTYVQGETLAIQISDTGIGIPPEYIERIFDPFWQVEQSATRRIGGTGLGLAVTRRLLNMMGGEIAVRSEVGQGATFTVRVPLRHAQHHSTPARS